VSIIRNKVIINFTYKIIFTVFLCFHFLETDGYGIYNADRDANSEERLHTVLIEAGNSDNKKVNCTGVLLSEVMVATAAHCLDGRDLIKVFEPGASRDEIIGGEIEVRSGIFFTFIESFKFFDNGIDDIGVIILNKPFSNYSIVYLSNNSDELALKGELHALGYGRDGRDSVSKNLKHGIFSYSDSYKSYGDSNKQVIGLGVRDSVTNKVSALCEGDSGGPLITYYNNKPILVGIAAGGFGDACKEFDNNKSYINLWSRVSYYQDFLYLDKELFKNNNNVIVHSKSNVSSCTNNYIYSNNYFLSGSLWDRCDLKLLNFEIFNLENTVELRVGINKVSYPNFYKSFENKIKNAKFSDKFELFFYSNDNKYYKNKFDYKLVDNKIYDNKNNFVCMVGSGYTKDGYGFTLRDDCLFMNGSYIIVLVYSVDMMYNYDGQSHSSSGNLDVISSHITNFNFIPPFNYPNVNPASKVNTSNLVNKLPISSPNGATVPVNAEIPTNPKLSENAPSESNKERIVYKGHCISDYDVTTEKYYNTKCRKGKIFKYSFCYKDKLLYLNTYKDDILISNKKVNGVKNISCRKYKVNYSYSISGEVLEQSNLYFIFSSISGDEFIKVLYAY